MSAVIYAAIVVMWAVVLVPMWLRRHDDVTQPRSADRFSTAMRILYRRSAPTPGSHSSAPPRRQGAVSVHAGASAHKPPAGRPAPPARPVGTATSIAVRRRRMLLGLLGVTALSLLLGAAGVISWPLQIVMDVVLVAFVVHLRAQARRAVAVSRQRRRGTAASAVRPEAATGVAPAAPRTEAAQQYGAADPTLPERAVEVTGTDGITRTWVPVPVPPPTYTLKPPAPTVSTAPTVDEPTQAASAPAEVAADTVAAHLDDILERRWAVND